MNEYLRDNAIHTFKQGDINSARQMFLECIRQDPRDVQSWLWLVETISDNKDRIATLKLCQKYNPDYEQVRQAISILSGQLNPKQSPGISHETALPETGTVPPVGTEKEVSLGWNNPAGSGLDLDSAFQEGARISKGKIEEKPAIPVKPSINTEQPAIGKHSIPSEKNTFGAEALRDGLLVEKEITVNDSLEEKREAILKRISQLSSINSTPKEETGLPESGKEKSAKRRVPFFISMTLITLLILVLFAFTFFDWWVLSGKDPDQILTLFNGGKTVASEVIPVATEEAQVSGVVVYPATYTPQPLPSLTFTPAPTINPFFAGIYQNDVPPEELLDLPSIATVATGKGMAAFQRSDGQIVILDAASEKLAEFTLPSSQPSQALAFSGDGQYLANAEIKGKITVWTTLTKPWEEVTTLSLNSTGQTVLIKQLTFSPDNSGLLVGYCNSFENECIELPRLVMFDIPSGAERFSQSGYDHGFLGNSNILLVWGQNKTATEIRLLSLQNGTATINLALSFPPEGEGWIVSAMSLDSSRAAAISTNGFLRVWDTTTGAIVAEWTSSVLSPDQILFSPDLTQVVIANDQSMAEVWDIATASKLIDFNLKADYGQFFWTSDWKLLCIRTVKPSMSIWDVMTLQSLEDIAGPESKVKEILLLPKNHKMLVITETGNISLWRSDFIR
jgi:WD40 repeat protein